MKQEDEKNLRQNIAQLDTFASLVLEDLQNFEDELFTRISDYDRVVDDLNTMQSTITTIQEEMGWLSLAATSKTKEELFNNLADWIGEKNNGISGFDPKWKEEGDTFYAGPVVMYAHEEENEFRSLCKIFEIKYQIAGTFIDGNREDCVVLKYIENG